MAALLYLWEDTRSFDRDVFSGGTLYGVKTSTLCSNAFLPNDFECVYIQRGIVRKHVWNIVPCSGGIGNKLKPFRCALDGEEGRHIQSTRSNNISHNLYEHIIW